MFQIFNAEKEVKREGIPLYWEVSVNPKTSPFLITSSRSLMWIEHETDRVRMAVRDVPVEALSQEILIAIEEKSEAESWETIFPKTKEGILEAINWVGANTPGLKPTVFSSLEGVDQSFLQSFSGEVIPHPGVPSGRLVALPMGGEFIGSIIDLGKGKKAALFYNLQYGVAIIR